MLSSIDQQHNAQNREHHFTGLPPLISRLIVKFVNLILLLTSFKLLSEEAHEHNE